MVCQACGTSNPADQEHCQRCGLRLMILSSIPDDGSGPGEEEIFLDEQDDLEENILERLTKLEDGLRHLAEAVATTAEHLAQLERNQTVTHVGVKTLTSLLETRGLVSRSEMLEDWERTAGEELHTRALARRFHNRSHRILSQAAHTGSDTPGFRAKLRDIERAMVESDLKTGLRRMIDLAVSAPGNDELWSLVGETAFEAGDLEVANDAFERVLALRGPHVETLIYLGTVATDLGRWDRAEAVLTQARDLAPTAFLPHFTLGALAGMSGRPEEATAHLEQAVALEPNPQSLYLLGMNYLELGKTGLAVSALRDAVDLAPDFEEAVYQLGVAYLRRGWPNKALETFRTVLRLDPRRLRYQETVRLFSLEPPHDLPAAAAGLAETAGAALAAGRQRFALDLFSQAVLAAPDHPGLRATTALLAAAEGRYRAAVRHAHQLLHRDRPDSPFLAAAIAALLESLRCAGHPRMARGFARRAFDASRNASVRGIAAYENALIAVDLGEDLGEAETRAREAVAFVPRELLHFPLAALGVLAIEAGRFTQAVRYLEQAAETTDAPDVQRLLGVARLAAGDREGARDALDTPAGEATPNLQTDLMGRLYGLSGLLDELKG